MEEHFDSISIARGKLLLRVEITVYHGGVVIKSQITTSEGEEVVTFGVIVSDDSALPLFLWVL